MPAILVVDDDSVDRELVSRCLRSIPDIEIRYASDGTQAIEEIARRQPDLVLTDLRMPQMDGLQLVEKVKQDYPQLPVVLMTARGSEQIAVQALAAGAASYVPKSVLKEELVDTVIQVLLIRESRRSQSEILPFLRGTETLFVLGNNPKHISPVAGFLQDHLERLEFGGETVRAHIGIALAEALANAMIHGNLEVPSELKRTSRAGFDRLIEERRNDPHYAERVVELEAKESPWRVEYVIRDQGGGFDVKSLPDPHRPENLLSLSGRGIMLMCAFMDEVTFNAKGNQVTLAKNNPHSTGSRNPLQRFRVTGRNQVN